VRLEQTYTQAAELELNPDDFRKLVAAQLTTEQIALVMEMMDRDAKAYADAIEARKAKGRERMAKWRLERHRNVTVTSPNVTEQLTGGDAHVEDKSLTTEIEPQVKKQNASGDADAFRAALSPDVPYDLITEFLKVRRKKRGAITGYAATLFREDAAKCDLSVAEAAKECVRSSWITVKPEYFQNRQRAGPASKPNPGLASVDALLEQMNAVPPSQTEPSPTYPRLVAPAGHR
jgi:hypothetical protein